MDYYRAMLRITALICMALALPAMANLDYLTELWTQAAPAGARLPTLLENIAAFAEGSTIHFIDLSQGGAPIRQKNVGSEIHALKLLSRNQNTLMAVGTAGGRMQILDYPAGNAIHTFYGAKGTVSQKWVTSIAAPRHKNPDWMVVGFSDLGVTAFDLIAGRTLHLGNSRIVPQAMRADQNFPVAISDDGRLVAAGYPDGSVQMWELPSGNEIKKSGGPLYAGSASVGSLGFTATGLSLAVGAPDRPEWVSLDLSGRELSRYQNLPVVPAGRTAGTPPEIFNSLMDVDRMHFTPDGSRAISAQRIRSSLNTSRARLTLQPPRTSVCAIVLTAANAASGSHAWEVAVGAFLSNSEVVIDELRRRIFTIGDQTAGAQLGYWEY